MPATGTNPKHKESKSIRLTADGFSFYPGREVVLVVGRSTWIPMERFSADHVTDIYNKVYAPNERPAVVRYNILPTLEVIEVWSVDKETEAQLRHDYPNHRWIGSNGLVLERVAGYERQHESGHRLYAYTHDGEMFIFDFECGRLHYANSFWPKDQEEARYFLLGVWNTLGMDAEKDECLLINDDTLTPLLTPYLRHVATLTPEMLRMNELRGIPFDIICV